MSHLRSVPSALIDEPMADPFVVRLTDQSPGGPRTAGLWMIATTSDQPFAFRLYRFDTVSGRWAPHIVGGQHQAIFPEGRLPAWWNQGEPNVFEPDLPRDLLLARWAPEIDVRDGRLTLHYTARDRHGILRSAYATAPCIDGDWTDHGFLDINQRARDVAPDYPGGIGGQNPVLGMIDAHVASATDTDGRERRFLLTKVDGNALSWMDASTGEPRKAPTPILSWEFVQRRDGRIELLGQPRVLASNQPHHDGLIEGQFVVQADGRSYLIYSAGFFGNDEYRTYVASVDLLRNEVADERLLIGSGSPALGRQWNGPGHPSLVAIGDGLFSMYLHVWRTGMDYLRNGDRRTAIQVHVSFRDPDGSITPPYVVEDRFAPTSAATARLASAGAVRQESSPRAA